MDTSDVSSRFSGLLYLGGFKLPKTTFINKLKFVFRPSILPISKLFEVIPSHTSVFDIGCGQGQLLALISKYKKPTKLGGVEIDPLLIANTKFVLDQISTNSTPSIKLFNGVSVSKNLGQYKTVLLVDVLHHIPASHRATFISSLRSVIGKKSILVVKDIAAEHKLLTMMNKLHDIIFSGAAGDEMTSKEFRRLMTTNGFMVEKITVSRVLWYPHFISVCYPV